MRTRKVTGTDDHTGTKASISGDIDRASPFHMYVNLPPQREMTCTNEEVRESYTPQSTACSIAELIQANAEGGAHSCRQKIKLLRSEEERARVYSSGIPCVRLSMK